MSTSNIERAFPSAPHAAGPVQFGYPPPECGLTKRELFAAMAMQGMMANPWGHQEWSLHEMTLRAVKAADLLLGALSDEQVTK